MRTAGAASASADGNRIEFRSDGFTEWYVNDSRGIEQGFTIHERPDGDGALRVELAVEGDLAPTTRRDRGVRFTDGNGRAVLSYDKLCVLDADGKELPARFDVASASVAIQVDDSCAVYPVVVDPTWSQVAKLTASDGAADAHFGGSVSMSGDTLVVGADWADVGGNTHQGAAYVFERNEGGPDAWGQVAKLIASDGVAHDWFGIEVTIDGDTVVVSAMIADVGGNADQGAAYVFERNEGGPDAWGQVKKLTASDGAADDWLAEVSVSGDTIVAGTGYADVGGNLNQGAVWIFERNEGGPGNWGQVKKLIASDGEQFDGLGSSLALDGYTLVIAAGGEGIGGSAYVFYRDRGGAGNWGEVAKFTGSDVAPSDYFGLYSSAMEGDTIVIGSYWVPVNPDGAAYVFERNAGGTDNWGEVKKLSAGDPPSSEAFGGSVSIGGDTIVVSVGGEDSAYVFERDEGGADNWGLRKKLTASDGEGSFGSHVVVSGDTVVVGASYADIGGNTDQGAAYVFYFLNSPPTAVASASPTSVEVGETVTFDGAGSTDPDGDPLSYSWDFGDSTSAAGVSPTHYYQAENTYTVTLTVDDGYGGTDTDTVQITVTAATDSDGDGLPDAWELAHYSDVLDCVPAEDSDGDGLTNAEEYAHGTDPWETDTDGDGYSDLDEINAGTDPLDASSHPGGGGGGGGGCAHGAGLAFCAFFAVALSRAIRRHR